MKLETPSGAEYLSDHPDAEEAFRDAASSEILSKEVPRPD
jgi:hypothetical protein